MIYILIFWYCFIYNSKVLNENLDTGIITYTQDRYIYHCDIKKTSGITVLIGTTLEDNEI